MSGPKILLRLPLLITEAITMVILMTGITTEEVITDMVGTPEEVGIGIIIPMVGTRIEEIIVVPTGPVVVVAARLDSFPALSGTRFPGKGPVFSSPFQVRYDGLSLYPSEGLEHSVGLVPVLDLSRTIG